MGRILIYKPIDIFFELVRTQFYEYRNAIENNRTIPKVLKRLLRIQMIYDSLSESDQNLI
jgi:hypothetical protein